MNKLLLLLTIIIKTKTKVITLANHKEHRHYSEPIKTDAKRGKTRASKSRLVLV